jgi:hypothetical protein
MAAMTQLSLTLNPMGKFQPMSTHYGPWQPCWISNQHQKYISGRGPSNEHFWQVWFNSVQFWFTEFLKLTIHAMFALS